MTTRILTTIFKYEFVWKSITKYKNYSPHYLLTLLLNYVQRSAPYSVNQIESG
jgi:hypothetical protein